MKFLLILSCIFFVSSLAGRREVMEIFSHPIIQKALAKSQQLSREVPQYQKKDSNFFKGFFSSKRQGSDFDDDDYDPNTAISNFEGNIYTLNQGGQRLFRLPNMVSGQDIEVNLTVTSGSLSFDSRFGIHTKENGFDPFFDILFGLREINVGSSYRFVIPYCQNAPIYYLGITNRATNPVSISVTARLGAFLERTTLIGFDNGTVTPWFGTSQLGEWSIAKLEIPSALADRAQRVSFSFSLHASDRKCLDDKTVDNYVTTHPNSELTMGFGDLTSFQVDVNMEDFFCQIPTRSDDVEELCQLPNFKTRNYEPDEVEEFENKLNFVVALLGLFLPKCANLIKEMSCELFFLPCQENNFEVEVCPTSICKLAKALVSTCGGEVETQEGVDSDFSEFDGVNCGSVQDPPHCHVLKSEGSIPNIFFSLIFALVIFLAF